MTLKVGARYAEFAKYELKKQRQRNLYFLNSHIFGDPAWEIILEAYIAASEKRCVVLSIIGKDLRRPVSMVTRLATILETEGFVERCHEHGNQQHDCVQLTNKAVIWCEQCLNFKVSGGVIQNN